MHELISMHQADLLMRAVLVIAPLVGLIIGLITKRLVPGVLIGLAVGAGNFALWSVYNAVTAHLGLDTVLNLEVNLGLFVIVGAIVGVGIGWYSGKKRRTE